MARARPGAASVPVTTTTKSPPHALQPSPAPAGMGEGHAWVRPVLTRLAVALSRRRAYSPTHPMVQQAESALAEEILPLITAGRILALGVAHRELLVDGLPVDSTGAVGRDLAERLYRRGVGAITVQRGVTLEGLRTMLGWIAAEREADDGDVPPQVTGFAVGRLAYDRLALSDDESVKAEIDALWRALAEAAFDDDRSWHAHHQKLDDATPEEVADAIRRNLSRHGYAERVGFVLGTLASHVGKAVPAVRDEIGNRLQRLMLRIGGQSIAGVIHAVGNGREQRRFVNGMVDVLPAKTVIEWLELAAEATNQELSHHLLRILSKLSVHAGRRRLRQSHDEFRDAARDLVDGWDLGDPNPDEHVALLDHIAVIGAAEPRVASHGKAFMTEHSLLGTTAEAARLVQMACELDVVGEDALASVETLVAAGQTQRVLKWLAAAPGSEAPPKLRAQLLSPAAIMGALICDPFDPVAAQMVLAELDSTKASVLLDALQTANSRVARRLIYDRLKAEGPSLFPELRRRLNGSPPWYLVRNLLALLRDIGVRLGGSDSGLWISDVAAYQTHSREQVRLEALRLLAHDVRSRDGAICRALDDASPRVIAAAVDAAMLMVNGTDDDDADNDPDGASPSITPVAAPVTIGAPGAPVPVLLSRELATRLMRLVDEEQGDEAMRARAVRALVAARGPTVRAWLLQLVSVRSRVLRRLRLAPPTLTVCTALDLLEEQYAEHPDVLRIVALANDQWGDRRTSAARAVPRRPDYSTWE
jgi:hypothetical protein